MYSCLTETLLPYSKAKTETAVTFRKFRLIWKRTPNFHNSMRKVTNMPRAKTTEKNLLR